VAKLPAPPSVERLRELGVEAATLPRGTLLWRIYFRGGDHPVSWRTFRAFGPVDARFDHHQPPPHEDEREGARAILYAARWWPTCVAEVFQRQREVDRRVREPWLVGFRLARGVRLLDLTGRWPTRSGASMAIHSGSRNRSREWSRAIHQAFPRVQGLLACSSMGSNRPTVALYERAAAAMPAKPMFHRALADPGLTPHLRAAAARLGYTMAP
jgi:hypothetical protein